MLNLKTTFSRFLFHHMQYYLICYYLSYDWKSHRISKYMISMYYKDNVDDVIAKAAQLF